MLRTLNRLACILVAAVILGGASYWMYKYTESQRRIAQLELEKAQLKQFVERLTSQRRVAEMMLIGRDNVDGVPIQKMIFVEYAKDGQTPVAIRRYDIRGKEVHVDAKVIQFDRGFIEENDPLRGSSVALFTRMYGDKTAPENGEVLDPPGQSPAVYAGANPQAAEFEAKLWKDFWKLLEDPEYAKQHGVRIAQGEGVWWPPTEGKLYTLSIAADGGLELKSEAVKAIYVEAMKKLAAGAAPATAPAAAIAGGGK